LVEAPGTAPGSEWFITISIYRHSCCQHPLYRFFFADCKGVEGCKQTLHLHEAVEMFHC